MQDVPRGNTLLSYEASEGYTAMPTYLVSIDIISASESLAQLIQLLDAAPDPAISHDGGSARSPTSKWKEALWRRSSKVEECASLDAHISDVLSRTPFIEEIHALVSSGDIRANLDVAVFLDSWNESFVLTPETIILIGNTGLPMSVTIYSGCREAETNAPGSVAES